MLAVVAHQVNAVDGRVGRHQLLRDAPAGVAAAVVDQHNLVALATLFQSCVQALGQFDQRFLAVINGYDYRKVFFHARASLSVVLRTIVRLHIFY